jgi:hypothetical protein
MLAWQTRVELQEITLILEQSLPLVVSRVSEYAVRVEPVSPLLPRVLLCFSVYPCLVSGRAALP